MMTASLESLRRREIPGGWTETAIFCGDRNWTILLPADADEFLNKLDLQPAAAEPDVYWAKLWPPALTMCQLISQVPWPTETTVLELGCGIGIVGLAALAAGWRVTFSDYVEIAVELALANASRNGFGAARGLVFDWREPPDEQFDVVLGSDILYDQKNHEPLTRVLDKMLRPHGTAWIGDAGRFHVSAFIELAWQRGFDVELRDHRSEMLRSPTSGEFQLLQLRRLP